MKSLTVRFLRGPLRGLVGLLLFLLGAITPPQGAVAAPVRVEAVEVELVAPARALRAGEWEWLGLRIRHDPHWHTYWRNPGDSGLPTRLSVQAPPGFEVGELNWPRPARFMIAPLASYGYEDEVVLPVRVKAPAEASGQRVELRAEASWLMCREVCIPGDAALKLSIPVIPAASPSERSVHAAGFERTLALLPTDKLALDASVSGAELSIALPASVMGAGTVLPRIEFFPYAEQGVRHAAAQRLLALPAGSEWPARLVLELSDEGRKLAADPGFARGELARGVLSVGDRIVEVMPRLIPAAFPAGAEIARLEAKPVVMPTGPATAPGSSRGGALGAFLPGMGSRSESGSSGVPGASGAGMAAPAGGSIWVALAFAVVGGLILNLMPCVFPVIGLKVLAFASYAQAAQQSHGVVGSNAQDAVATRASALAFSAGVMLSFIALGALMLGLKFFGLAAGWGFQLQSPVFVTAMALLFIVIGLNLAGVFEVGLGLTRLSRFDMGPQSQSNASQHWSAHAASGALAVLVATPCTAPFMASALGYTLSANAAEALAVFAAVGLGMALPYWLLGWFPGWLRWLPRPGRWMESLRQLLAFPMFVTAAWLAWVLGQQVGVDAVFALTVGAVLIGLGAWCWGRFVQPRGVADARFASAVAVASLVAGVWLALSNAEEAVDEPRPGSGAGVTLGDNSNQAVQPDVGADPSSLPTAAWQAWSQQRVAEALAAGRPVFVDFTAAWCVSCQANKKLVLDRDAVVGAMAERGVVRLRADWTQRDAAIGAELARHGRNGVPLYLLFDPASKTPRILPELLTVGIVNDALSALPVRRPGIAK
jgi:thiol:disulfide interchange protein/DsbC/DsbD-like thiol-disulfide interchange protein